MAKVTKAMQEKIAAVSRELTAACHARRDADNEDSWARRADPYNIPVGPAALAAQARYAAALAAANELRAEVQARRMGIMTVTDHREYAMIDFRPTSALRRKAREDAAWRDCMGSRA